MYNINRTEFIEKINNEYYKKNISDMLVVEASIKFSKEDNIVNTLKEILFKSFGIKEFNNDFEYDINNIFNNQERINYNILYDILLKNKIIESQEKILIYRIETNENEGIYHSFLLKNIDKYPDFFENYKKRPSPLEDSSLRSVFSSISCSGSYKKNWKFGFKSIKQLKNWFDDEIIINDMIKNNAKIVIYSGVLSDVIITEKQVVFLDDKFTRKKTMKLESLLKKKIKIKKMTR